MTTLRLNEFNALPGRLEDLIGALTAVVAQIRTVDGNLSCELLLKVTDGASDDEKLVVREVWQSVEAHRATASAIDPAQLAAVTALLAEKPSGCYYTAIEG